MLFAHFTQVRHFCKLCTLTRRLGISTLFPRWLVDFRKLFSQPLKINRSIDTKIDGFNKEAFDLHLVKLNQSKNSNVERNFRKIVDICSYDPCVDRSTIDFTFGNRYLNAQKCGFLSRSVIGYCAIWRCRVKQSKSLYYLWYIQHAWGAIVGFVCCCSGLPFGVSFVNRLWNSSALILKGFLLW